MKEIKAFLSKFIPRTNTDAFVQAFDVIRKIKKKEFLLQPDQNYNYLAFIRKGTFRVFFTITKVLKLRCGSPGREC